MLRTRFVLIAALALAGAFSIAPRAQQSQTTSTGPVSLEEALRAAYRWRSIGPARGGRSIAVSGVKGRPKEAYFGATGGGLWKTVDGGENWSPVTDGQIASSSVGAVAVAESNPNVVFIGMGESCIRGNIMSGDGVYKSTDAGNTWTHVGFRDARNISKIRIHPANADTVFVAAFGHHGAPNAERGVFKSVDGGRTWRKTLFRDDKTGAVDLWIDRKTPDVIYAALWEAYRVEYQMSSGGPGSGLFKSTDGGETWKEITRNPGLPTGVIGRIGISVSGADSNRVYALIEHQDGGLFVSDDAGATWKLVNDDRRIRQRAFYYTHVTADPSAKDTVYLLNTAAFRSTDGGKTLASVGGGTHGDHHDLWIDPDDPAHLVIGNDGGGAVSMASGQGWTPQDFATPQYYHVATTKHVPYHVCGAQQDGSTVCLPSSSPSPAYGQGGAPPAQGRGGAGRGGFGGGRGGGVVQPYGAGGSEPGYIAPDPKDPDVIFAGGNNGTFLTRLNRRTGHIREVNPEPRIYSGEPAGSLKERWQWTYPIVFSPVDPNILYTSSQRVWKTTNGGQRWEPISGDLTRHDPKTLGHSGGPITGDMNGPEIYATVFTLAPSKRDVGVLWAGSDDGLIHVTRDGGKSWTNVTPKQMPEFGRVSLIDASAFDASTAYAAVKRPLLDDFAPYIFRTTDFGATWTKIVDGIRPDDYVHAVREDPSRRGLIYAGTQHGIYMSLDDGTSWMSISENLPDTQVSSIIVEDNDLVVATHGRGFYILDDINPIRQAMDVGGASAYLFAPAAAIRSAGGATFSYFLERPAQSLKIEVLDGKGDVIHAIDGRPPEQGRGRGDTPEGASGRGGGRGRGGAPTGAPMTPGVHRVNWNLQYPGATTFEGMILWGASTAGPTAVPGKYQVRMTVDGQTQTQPLVVRKHPLYTDITEADLQAQFELAIRIRDKVSEANRAVIQIRKLKQQVADRVAKQADTRLQAAGGRLTANLSSVEEEIYQVRNQSGQDPLNFPIKTNNRLAGLLRVVNFGDGRPIGNAEAIFADLVAELKSHTDRLQQVLATDLPAFNAEAKRLKLPPVGVSGSTE